MQIFKVSLAKNRFVNGHGLVKWRVILFNSIIALFYVYTFRNGEQDYSVHYLISRENITR